MSVGEEKVEGSVGIVGDVGPGVISVVTVVDGSNVVVAVLGVVMSVGVVVSGVVGVVVVGVVSPVVDVGSLMATLITTETEEERTGTRSDSMAFGNF